MAVGSKLRFEVFKRDQFTCQYCGRKTPAVILECDHVVPVSEGGPDEIENLTTSCFQCNRGKGATLLGELPPSADVHERAVLLAEREIQIREYNTVRAQQREREETEIGWLLSVWKERIPWCGRMPAESTLRRYLQTLSVYDIADAIEIAGEAQTNNGSAGKVAYFCGVMKRKAEAANA